MSTPYQVELSDGTTINVPRDVRTQWERIDIYGLSAVLKRVKRTRAYIRANANHDVDFRAIVCPNGDRVTQF